MLEGRPFTVHRQEPLPAVGLQAEVRRHLLLIVKEALRNAMEHAPGAHVTLRVALEGDQLMVEVEDNGIGYDVEQVQAGRGLSTLRRRAEALAADLEVRSEPGTGTLVRLRWPLPRVRQQPLA